MRGMDSNTTNFGLQALIPFIHTGMTCHSGKTKKNRTMKKRFLFTLFILVTAGCYSQTLNLRGGPTFSSLNWENSLVTNNQFDKNYTGFDVMLGYDYLDFRYFDLSTNLGFIQKGGSATVLFINGTGPEEGGLHNATIKLNYLTVNTIFEAKLPINDFIVPFIHAGPRLDYLVGYNDPSSLLHYFEELDQLHKYIYGLVAGGGIDFKLKRFKLGIMCDYYWNFNKLVDYTADTGVRNQISDKTFILNFQMGYQF